MEPETEKWKKEKLKSKNGYDPKYRETVQGIGGVSLVSSLRNILMTTLFMHNSFINLTEMPLRTCV